MPKVSLNISDDLNDWLEKKSEEKDLNKSELVRLVLNKVKDEALAIQIRGPLLGLKWRSSSIDFEDKEEKGE